MTTELLPCPFCQKTPSDRPYIGGDKKAVQEVTCRTPQCPAGLFWAKDYLWNRRAAPEPAPIPVNSMYRTPPKKPPVPPTKLDARAKAECIVLPIWNRIEQRGAIHESVYHALIGAVADLLNPTEPAQSYRERAEAFDRNYSGEPSGEPFRIALAAEFAAVAEEARPKPNSTDKAVVDALIDRHKGLPGSSDEWCICLSDQFRHDLEVIMAAVREAATKAERERCAKIADKYYNEQMAFAQNWPNRPTGIPDTGAAIRRKP